MNRTFNKCDNVLIEKRRKKIFLKKCILFFIFIISVFLVLCFKLPYFNISNISVVNNKLVTKEEIIKLCAIKAGNNIFYINTSRSSEKILKNPYILSAKVERKFPNNIIIDVVEREAMYYNIKDNKYLVIDKNGIVLEEREEINNMRLIKLEGFDYNKAEIGMKLTSDDDRRIEAVSELAKIVKANKFFLKVTNIDVTNPYALNVYYGNICIKLGSCDNIDKKLNAAANILERDELKQGKGYIDVSFDGNPVFFMEK